MEARDRNRDELHRRWRLWMIAAQAGDAATYEKLLLELLPAVRSQVARSVGEKDEREDIVQNVLISVHRARCTYRSERPFVPWLRAVVRNASIDWMRARGRRARHEWTGDVDDLPESESSYTAPPPGPVERLQREDVRAYVHQEIDRLPETYRAVLILRDLEELDTAETAAILACTAGSVRVRHHRARLALRAQIALRAESETGAPSPVAPPGVWDSGIPSANC